MWGLNDVLTYSIAYGMGEEEGRAKGEKEKKKESPWHTGTPTEEGFWLVKYKCVVEGKYNGRLTYRAVKIEKDKIDGFAYESGGIGAEEYWKPIEYQKIDDLWRGEE